MPGIHLHPVCSFPTRMGDCNLCQRSFLEGQKLLSCIECKCIVHAVCGLHKDAKEIDLRQYRRWTCEKCKEPFNNSSITARSPTTSVKEKGEVNLTDIENLDIKDVLQMLLLRQIETNKKLESIELAQTLQFQEIKQSLDEIPKLQQQMASQNESLASLRTEVEELKEKNRHLTEQLDDLTNRSMRDNLVFSGIPQSNDTESWEESEAKVHDVLRRLGVDNVSIDRAHRVYRRHAGTNKAVDIVARIPSSKDRVLILRNRKKLSGTNVYVNEQFSRKINTARFHLRQAMRSARTSGKTAVLIRDTLWIDNCAFVYDHDVGKVKPKEHHQRNRRPPDDQGSGSGV